VDTTKEAVEKLRRRHLIRWHRKWVAPNNAFLVVAGDVTGERASELAEKEFKRWRQKKIPEREYPEPPERDQRRVVVVDRPQSVQSVIRIGNLAIARDHKDWIPLKVANQVLGGSAASRLFMDLREKRSLTYGAYSRVRSRVQVAPFRASASVRTEVTPRAVQAFFHHLDRITSEAPPEPELADAKRYLSDSFPLQIDTPGKIASMIADLRVYGLPDDYWNTYRSRIGEVSQDQSLKAAQEHIRPEQSLVVVVGRAASVVEPLRKWGPVTVVDTQGKVLEKFEKSSAEGDSKSETEDASGSKTSASQGEGG
jgi:predicted Zn-dependent peptidase